MRWTVVSNCVSVFLDEIDCCFITVSMSPLMRWTVVPVSLSSLMRWTVVPVSLSSLMRWTVVHNCVSVFLDEMDCCS